MLQLNNKTPFAADFAIFPNEQGIDSLFVIVKATFQMSEQLSLAKQQISPQMGDEYWGEPGLSSIKKLSDFHIGKSATDIIMQGDACAPNKQNVRQLDVHLSVGSIKKTIRVFGDRQWLNGEPTIPAPFQTMPMVYERSFGGEHQVDDNIKLVEERNLIGTGFAGKRSKKEMDGIALANLEDPNHLIHHFQDKPAPACFAPLSSENLPRKQFAGTYDEEWQTTRAPYLPFDFDKRFLNAAPSDLIYPDFIKGGEPIFIRNMHPAGDIQLTVPYVNLSCGIKLNDKIHLAQFNIETLCLMPNQLEFTMVWMAAFECDKNIVNIEELEVTLLRQQQA